MPPPPVVHPLPARPTVSAAAAASAGLPQRPHTPSSGSYAHQALGNNHQSNSQPASPRQPFSQQQQHQQQSDSSHHGSPKLPQHPNNRIEEPVTSTRKPIEQHKLRLNSHTLELGQGWKVKWRAWRGPSLMSATHAASQFSASSGTHSRTNTTIKLSSSSTLPSGVKSGRGLAPEEATVDHSQADIQGGASTSSSSSRTLKERLQSLQQISFESDPVERARKVIAKSGPDQPFRLFGYVKVTGTKSPDNVKGKGKEKERPVEERDDAAGRLLWAFTLQRSGEPTELDIAANQALAGLDFPDLNCIGKGHFGHRELYPALYPESSTSTGQPPSCVAMRSLPAAMYPSIIDLSAALNADFAAASNTSVPVAVNRTRTPHEAFIAAASEELIKGALLDSSASVSMRLRRATRLESSLIYLSPISEPFGAHGRKNAEESIQVTMFVSLQRQGMLIQPSVNEIAYRPMSCANLPRPGAPILLSPFRLEAQFIASAVHDAKGGTLGEQAMVDAWVSLLVGTGLALAEDEGWISCRLELPTTSSSMVSSPTAAPKTNETLEVIWPASLCLLDGTRPQPTASPDYSPPRIKPAALVSAAPSPLASTSNATASATSPNPSSTLPWTHLQDVTSRWRLAAVVSNNLGDPNTMPSDIVDPITLRADRISSMLIEAEEERERKERLEREAASAAAATSMTSGANENARGPSANGSNSTTSNGAQAGLAGAPINMRTPISLGSSSTEAPSPADGLVGMGLSGGASIFGSALGFNGGISTADSVGITKTAELSHLYPSPIDLSSSFNTAGGFASTADTNMSTMDLAEASDVDIAGFPDFDWGEHLAGGTTHGGSMRNQDFDDGMLMGLTDDDFSFFDDPAPLPVSLPMNSFGGLQSAGPSPKFVDHFSHLAASTPFASAASPSSPFGHPSPHPQPSPSLPQYHFDAGNTTHLAGSTPRGATSTLLPLAEASPLKTPRTPYTPIVEGVDEQLRANTTGHAPLAVPSVSVATTPGGTLMVAHRPQHQAFPSLFDPVAFGASHAQSDEKYDSRKGKFGLPSPDWERDVRQLRLAPDDTAALTQKFAAFPWYTIVGDPRVSMAKELKRKRTASLGRRHDIQSSGSMNHRAYSRGVCGRSRFANVGDGYGNAAMDSEASEFASDDEDELDVVMQGIKYDADRRGSASDDENDSTHPNHRGTSLRYTFGAALLLLRQHASILLAPRESASGPDPIPTKAMLSADGHLETALALIGDQTMYNPDFRGRPLLALDQVKSSAPTTVFSRAIKLATTCIEAVIARSQVASMPDIHVETDSQWTLTLQPPASIRVRSQQSIVELRASAKPFWRTMGFEPLAGGKDVTAFAMFEEGGSELSATVAKWLRDVTDTYQSCRLGNHGLGSVAASGSFSGIADGLAVLPAGVLSTPRVREELRGLATHLLESARHRKHVVIYLLAPLEAHSNSPTAPVVSALQQIFKSKTPNMSIVIYPLPLSTVVRWRHLLRTDTSSRRLERLVFSVYDQLLVPVSSLALPVPETFPSANHSRHPSLGPVTRLFQSPALTITPARMCRTEFDLSWPPTSLDVEHRHRLLHVSYASLSAPGADGVERMVVSCIDEVGEVWKTLPRILRHPPSAIPEVQRIRQVWSITQLLAGTADVEWRVIISKLGLPNEAEVKAWDTLLKEVGPGLRRPLHVTIVAVDLQPPISVIEQLFETARAATSTEEGEVDPDVALSKPAHLDDQARMFTYTPAEPIALPSSPSLIAPATSYIVHIPRMSSLTHTTIDAFMPRSPAVSAFGVHFLMSRQSKSSSLKIPLHQHVDDVTKSFIQLAALAEVRWGASGRLPWPLEACHLFIENLL